MELNHRFRRILCKSNAFNLIIFAFNLIIFMLVIASIFFPSISPSCCFSLLLFQFILCLQFHHALFHSQYASPDDCKLQLKGFSSFLWRGFGQTHNALCLGTIFQCPDGLVSLLVLVLIYLHCCPTIYDLIVASFET